MTKRIIFTLIALMVLIGVLGGIKALQIKRMIAHGRQSGPPPKAVTTAVVKRDSWESLIGSVGSLVAVQGVTVTAELSGKVVAIAFEAGSRVNAGDLLVRQDTSSEEAQLRAIEATVGLAQINFNRARQLVNQNAASQSDLDNARAQLKESVAQAENIRTIIRKKTIRAPFSGRLGIRLINMGQVINAGDPIVSLQSLDPIFVNFLLPQQQLSEIGMGIDVRITTDALPGKVVGGTITAVNPQVDAATRNIEVQATLPNPGERLRPGMFVNVEVVLPEQRSVLAIPATAVLYAPYSNSVFVVEEKKRGDAGEPGMVVRQQFVRLGERRGDFVSVLDGVREGETVVTTGVFKLRNGQAVVVNNTLSPEFMLNPRPEES